jgi:hypothetical protein
VTLATTESRVQPLSWVAFPGALDTLLCRIQSVVVVVDVSRHYIIPRMPSSPTCFHDSSCLMNTNKRELSFFFVFIYGIIFSILDYPISVLSRSEYGIPCIQIWTSQDDSTYVERNHIYNYFINKDLIDGKLKLPLLVHFQFHILSYPA